MRRSITDQERAARIAKHGSIKKYRQYRLSVLKLAKMRKLERLKRDEGET